MACRRPDVWFFLFVAALGVAAWLRFPDLGRRTIHADEAVQGWKTGELLDGGGYHYDPADHHGPTLYFFAAPLARAFGESTLQSLRIETLRLLPAMAGLGVVLATGGFGFLIGRRAAMAAALVTGVSPILVFYSRHFIQEMLLVLFTTWFLLGVWKWLSGGSKWWLPVSGAAFGLMVATKEPWVLVSGATIAGVVAAIFAETQYRRRLLCRDSLAWAAGSAVFGLAIAAGLYSSGFSNPGALGDVWNGLVIGAQRAGDGGHPKSWDYYFTTLWWTHQRGFTYTELGLVALAFVSLPTTWDTTLRALERSGARFFWVYAIVLGAAYTVIPYKTIWLACGVLHGGAILAGIGIARLLGKPRPHLVIWTAALFIAAVVGHYGWQGHRAAGMDASRPWNPYAYVETSADIARLKPRLEAIARAHPDGERMTIKVGMPNFWPIPWFLREFPNVGYWTEPAFDPAAAVLITSPEWYERFPEVGEADPGIEIFGLREGELAIMATERGLWERSLEDTP